MLSQKDKEIEALRECQNNSTNVLKESHRLEDEVVKLKSMVESISQEKVYLYNLMICSTLVEQDAVMKEQKSAMMLVENLRKELNEKVCQIFYYVANKTDWLYLIGIPVSGECKGTDSLILCLVTYVAKLVDSRITY